MWFGICMRCTLRPWLKSSCGRCSSLAAPPKRPLFGTSDHVGEVLRPHSYIWCEPTALRDRRSLVRNIALRTTLASHDSLLDPGHISLCSSVLLHGVGWGYVAASKGRVRLNATSSCCGAVRNLSYGRTQDAPSGFRAWQAQNFASDVQIAGVLCMQNLL